MRGQPYKTNVITTLFADNLVNLVGDVCPTGKSLCFACACEGVSEREISDLIVSAASGVVR